MAIAPVHKPQNSNKNVNTNVIAAPQTMPIYDALCQLWRCAAHGIRAPYLRFRRYHRNKFLLILFLSTLFYTVTTITIARFPKASAILAASTTTTTTTTAATADPPAPTPSLNAPIVPTDCPSIDVRNDCDSLLCLTNCTVIRGYLIIVLVPKVRFNHHGNITYDNHELCDYSQYRFPLLREITDFMIFFDVKGLRNIRELFPNLTVIRGRRLFLNYALGITNMPDLEVLEFKSLVAIQRGHVFIGSNPKLCNLEKINWDRLTLSVGKNHIYPVDPDTCPTQSLCIGCATEYCWSNDICQSFENDNVVDAEQGIHHCHEECLGGCYNSTREGCVVCKRLTDNGVCVKDCPANKFLFEDNQRCYTEDECRNRFDLQVIGNECREDCDATFIPEVSYSSSYFLKGRGDRSGGCAPCQALSENIAIFVVHLGDLEQITGCEVLNSSVVISIKNKIDLQELKHAFRNVREIRGYLKIKRATALTSLDFLQPLKKITGSQLDGNHYGVSIFHNANLKELWHPKTLELEKGSMYIQRNDKLCNRKLRDFTKRIVHDKTYDLLQTNDQEVLCEPAKLQLQVDVLSHSELLLTWRKDQTAEEVEVLLRPLQPGEILEDNSELDSFVCNRMRWQRFLILRKDMSGNATHYSYNVRNLQAGTRYACLLKTFGLDDISRDASSDLLYLTTAMDFPLAPLLRITKKTDVSLTLQIEPQRLSSTLIHSYMLEMYELLDDQNMLDKRDYCEQSAIMYDDTPEPDSVDYEVCCSRLEEAAEDEYFQSQMRTEFRCNLEHDQYCMDDMTATSQTEAGMAFAKPKLSRRLDESNVTTQLLPHLERYRLYVLQVKACNEIGCGTYGTIWARTNFSIAGDRLEDLRACRVQSTYDFHVEFKDPPHPNGPVVSYSIHYRLHVPKDKSYLTHVECVTRSQHAADGFHHIAQLNTSFNEVAVRVHSLAGGIFTHWVNVTDCTKNDNVIYVRKAGGINLFLLFFLIAATAAVLWLCYKRRLWRKLPELCRSVFQFCNWRPRFLRPEPLSDDRETLVEDIQTVRFRNDPDDNQIFLGY